jgi:hypothetical protein
MSEILFPAEARYFSLLHSIQTASGAHPASYPTGTKGSFLGLKKYEREADYCSFFI